MSVQITVVATGESFAAALALLSFAPAPAATTRPDPKPETATSPTPPAPAPANKPVKDSKPAKDASGGAKDSSSAANAASQGSAEKQADAAEQTGEVIDYEVLKKAVFKLAGLNGPAMLAIKDSFGVDHFNKIPPEKRGEALAALNAKIAELESA